MNEENSAPESKTINWGKVKSFFKEVIIFVVIAVFIVLPFRMYVAEPYLVDGRSMYPSFNTGDYLIVKKFGNKNSTFERNKVVVFKYPNDPSKSFVKRVIGLPGETVVIQNGIVTIINSENPNGIVLEQAFVEKEKNTNSTTELSGNEYFVMGDNRAESFDSRSWGPLKKELILGEPVVQLWPLNKIRLLNNTK